MSETTNRTTIGVSIETHAKLKKLGGKDESFDSIINRLLETHKEASA